MGPETQTIDGVLRGVDAPQRERARGTSATSYLEMKDHGRRQLHSRFSLGDEEGR